MESFISIYLTIDKLIVHPTWKIRTSK